MSPHEHERRAAGDAPVRHPTPARRTPDPAADGLPAAMLGGGTAPRAAALARLQRTAGNARVQRALSGMTALHRDADPGAAPTPDAAAAGTIVDDTAPQLAEGQMRRSAFLAALRAELDGVVASADVVAQADARLTMPGAFAELAGQDAAGVERSVRAQLPGVEPGDARRYVAAAGTAARAQLAGAVAPPQGLVGRAIAAVGALASALFKARDGRATPADAHVVRRGLGAGQPLDAGLRAPMEHAYGRSFADVRVHTDGPAGALSEQLGARAFTVGHDIAFSPGEYQPASPVGSALVAHELAHVGQQGGDGSSDAALEDDADRAAVGAVVSQWTGDVGGPQLEGVMPRLRAGLRLQRCTGGAAQGRGPAAPAVTPLTAEQWRAAVTAARGLSGDARGTAMLQLVQNALTPLGITVRAAGTGHAEEAHPEDYAPIPVVNFDVRLNEKTKWSGARGGAGRSLEPNAGYNIPRRGGGFVVLGPKALDEHSPLTTRLFAQHELQLVSLERNGRSPDELELLTWTDDFRRYFHQFLGHRHQQNWMATLGRYYDASGPAVRQESIRSLVQYFTHPPADVDADRLRRAMRSKLADATGVFATDLTAALP